VLGKGDIPCDILFVGEAPGDSEDDIGIPFCGPAGDFLHRYIVDPVLKANPQYTAAFTNLVCCLPKNEDGAKGKPDPGEIQACRARLEEFADICNPTLLVAIGDLAENWTRWWPKLHCGFYHPAWILRQKMGVRPGMVQRCKVILQEAIEQIAGFVMPDPELLALARREENLNAEDIPF
jgi:uracil-DNA glycosylase